MGGKYIFFLFYFINAGLLPKLPPKVRPPESRPTGHPLYIALNGWMVLVNSK